MATKPDPKKLIKADLARAKEAGVSPAIIEAVARALGLRKPRKK